MVLFYLWLQAAKPCDMVEPNFGSVLGMFQPIGAPCLLPTLRPRGMKLPERDYRNVVKPANFSLPPRFLALPGSATHKEPPHHLFGFYVFKFQGESHFLSHIYLAAVENIIFKYNIIIDRKSITTDRMQL